MVSFWAEGYSNVFHFVVDKNVARLHLFTPVSITIFVCFTMARDYPSFAFGHRILTETLSDLASLHPDRIYASVPKTNNLADGFLEVSFRDMERMTNAFTGWIVDTWGRSSSFETITYIGIPDLRSVVVFFAAVRNGYKVI